MLSQSEFLKAFVGDLLDLQQIKFGRIEFQNAVFSPVALLQNIYEIFAPQANTRQIKLTVRIGNTNVEQLGAPWNEQLMPRLIGDERRLKQVIINLVRNAIKFTKACGEIIIRVYYHEAPLNGLFVQVIDTGVGFAAEERDTLFTRFGKLQRTANINSEGLGLGLMIVK